MVRRKHARRDFLLQKGRLKTGKDKVAALCEENSFLVLQSAPPFQGRYWSRLTYKGSDSISTGIAPAGKQPLNTRRCPCGDQGNPCCPGARQQMDLEAHAAARSSTFLALDESHQVDPKTLDSSVYMLLNGAPKAACPATFMLRSVATWSYPYLVQEKTR